MWRAIVFLGLFISEFRYMPAFDCFWESGVMIRNQRANEVRNYWPGYWRS